MGLKRQFSQFFVFFYLYKFTNLIEVGPLTYTSILYCYRRREPKEERLLQELLEEVASLFFGATIIEAEEGLHVAPIELYKFLTTTRHF